MRFLQQRTHSRRAGARVLILLVLLGAACSNDLPDPGPVLVEDITLAPTLDITQPALTLSPQATPSATPSITAAAQASEEPTQDAFASPTEPPTKTATPSVTATFTPTFTVTATWTPTVTGTPGVPFPTATQLLTANAPPPLQPSPTIPSVPGQSGIGEVAGFPNSGGNPNFGQTPQTGLAGAPAAVGGTPVPPGTFGSSCIYYWFFSSRAVPYCAAAPPLTTQAVNLQFENGIMFWFQGAQTIYVLYLDAAAPRWERYTDTWQEGMPETDPAIQNPVNLWQPRRGFGQVWRTNPAVRQRLGWALNQWETIYQGIIQQAGPEGSGTLFFTGPEGRAYQLNGDQTQWTVFTP